MLCSPSITVLVCDAARSVEPTHRLRALGGRVSRVMARAKAGVLAVRWRAKAGLSVVRRHAAVEYARPFVL